MKRLEPMLASVGTEVPQGEDWVFEPKYDGIRILAFVDKGAVALVSRNGLNKTHSFPEIADALGAGLAASRPEPRRTRGGVALSSRNGMATQRRYPPSQPEFDRVDSGVRERS